MASFQIMKQSGVRVIHDATHCVQRPGGLGKSTGGKREQIFTLCQEVEYIKMKVILMQSKEYPRKS